ncbi:MAG: DUF3379 domain-containing protein [Gammaproteobacteria bacterium]|nr:DUF3379 domain-containing protein [Gammaproteobacteria bacterium]
MDELALRKQLQAAPNQLDDEMLAYLESNPEQKKVVKQVRAFDKQIHAALEVEVPEGLHARILLNQSYQAGQADSVDSAEPVLEAAPKADSKADVSTTTHAEKREGRADKLVAFWHKERDLSWAGLLVMAASLMVVAVSITLWQAPQQIEQVSGSEIIAHIVDHIGEDPSLMTAVKPSENETDIPALFATVGAHLDQPIKQMSYVGHCVIKGQKGLHIVMQSDNGPVTVIVIPGQQLAAMEAFQTSGYQGELIPVKGGIVAIVATSMEQLALAQIRFFKAVNFT